MDKIYGTSYNDSTKEYPHSEKLSPLLLHLYVYIYIVALYTVEKLTIGHVAAQLRHQRAHGHVHIHY